MVSNGDMIGNWQQSGTLLYTYVVQKVSGSDIVSTFHCISSENKVLPLPKRIVAMLGTNNHLYYPALLQTMTKQLKGIDTLVH